MCIFFNINLKFKYKEYACICIYIHMYKPSNLCSNESPLKSELALLQTHQFHPHRSFIYEEKKNMH